MHHTGDKQQRAACLDDLGRVIITNDRAVEVVAEKRFWENRSSRRSRSTQSIRGSCGRRQGSQEGQCSAHDDGERPLAFGRRVCGFCEQEAFLWSCLVVVSEIFSSECCVCKLFGKERRSPGRFLVMRNGRQQAVAELKSLTLKIVTAVLLHSGLSTMTLPWSAQVLQLV